MLTHSLKPSTAYSGSWRANERRLRNDWREKMNSARSWLLLSLFLVTLISFAGCGKHIEKPSPILPLPAPVLLEAVSLEAAMVNLDFLLQGPATVEELDEATTRVIGACKADSIRLSGWLEWWENVPAELK